MFASVEFAYFEIFYDVHDCYVFNELINGSLRVSTHQTMSNIWENKIDAEVYKNSTPFSV